LAPVSKEGRRFVAWYSLALIVALAAPYLVAFASTGSGWEFSGFLVGVQDGNSYIAKMRQAADGAWLFRSPYSTAPQAGVLAFVPYVLLGKLAAGAGMHLQLVSLFHLARLMLIAVEVLAVYRFASLFVEQELWRRWVTVMATLGGGLGWILILAGEGNWLGSLPLDLHSPEAFGFLALLGLPHLVLARALLLFGLADHIRAGESGRRSWRAGLWLALLALVHPLSGAVAAAVLAAHLAWVAVVSAIRRTRSDLRPIASAAIRSALPMAPLLLYYVWSFAADPYLKGWTVQNRILSPHPGHYLVAYGLVALPAIAGGVALMRQPHPFKWLLVSWALALPLLAYAPTPLQRRLPEGLWVALAVLAALGLQGLAGLTPKRRWSAAVVVLALSLPTTLILWVGSLQLAARPRPPAFLPAAMVQAFDWIDASLPPGSVVAAKFDVSNALPAWSDVVVVAGHGPESVDLDVTLPKLNALLAGEMAAGDRDTFIAEQGINMILLDPELAGLPAWSGDQTAGTSSLYNERGYVVLGVER
jgi:hypothetical protein